MKIGIMTSSMDWEIFGGQTGPGNYIYNLCKAMLKVKEDEEIYFIHYRKSSNELYKEGNEIIAPILPLRTELFLRKFDFDIVHLHGEPHIDPKPPYRRPFWLHRKKSKIVTTMHAIEALVLSLEGSEFGEIRFPRLKRYILEKLFSKVDAVITISNHSKKDLMEYLKIPEEKIRVIYHGIDGIFRPIDGANHVIRRYGIDSPFILHVSNYAPRKNPETLIKAFHKLKKEKMVNHKLVIAGRRWERSGIYDFVKKLDLQNDIIFTGNVPREDLVSFYNAADTFVFPSIDEGGFAFPVLEAMACGCPTICSNIFDDKVIGDAALLLDEPLDSQDLAEKMYDVLIDEDLRNKLREKGLKRAKNFSWEQCARETLDIYRRIAEDNRNSREKEK